MTRGTGDRQANSNLLGPASTLMPASLWRLFVVAWVAMALIWLPLSAIPILDSLLFLAPLRDVLRDLALFIGLSLLPAALLAGMAWAVARLARALGAGDARISLLAWSVLLLPLGLICAWQAGRMAWQWLRAIAGTELAVSQEMRGAAMLLLLAALVFAWRRLSLTGMLQRLAWPLYSARWVCMGVFGAALSVVLLHPPTVLIGNVRPATAPTTPRSGPDIIVIALDTVAAIDADVCNPASTAMPRLAAFATGASCFTRFYAASNFTTPTTSTMESGLLPWSHFATQPDATMAEHTRAHSVAGVLKRAGWRTHSVTDNMLGSPRHRGSFANYTSSEFSRTTLSSDWLRQAMTMFPDTALPRLATTAMSLVGAFDMALHGHRSPYDSERTYAAMRALIAQERGDAPVLLWALTLPPHAPYLPPAAFKYRLLPRGELETWRQMLPDNIEYGPAAQAQVDKHRLRYRESMMAADASLGDFLDELERQGRLQTAVVLVTSDHGESFEKGLLGHAGPKTHEALIRVPMVVKLPGQTRGQVLHAPASQADIAPTLLDLAGAAPLPQAEGRSLRAALQGQALPQAPVFAMTMERQSRFEPLTQGSFVVIDGDEKLTLTLTPPGTASTLHDLAADPGETRDLAASRPERVRTLEALLRQRLAAAEQRRLAAAPLQR